MAMLAQLIDDVVVHKFDLSPEALTIGRHPDNSVVIDDSAVSAKHAKVIQKSNVHFPEYKETYISDLGSTNGTYVNELPVSEEYRLHHNDIVRIAWNKFKFIDDKEADMERTVHMIQQK